MIRMKQRMGRGASSSHAVGLRAGLILLFILIASPPLWSQPVSSQPQGPIDISIDDHYQPNPNGPWWLRPNYEDTDGDGRIGTSDWFLFQDAHGQRIELGDPSIFRLDYRDHHSIPDGPAWFFTGSANDRNLWIYRTRDFSTFNFHMTAFDDQPGTANCTADPAFRPATNQFGGIPGGSGQPPERHFIDTGDDPNDDSDDLHRVLEQLWAGQLYQDPETLASIANPLILLTFSAERYEVDGTCKIIRGGDSNGWRSVFQARIRKNRFDAWFDLDPHAGVAGDDGPRFQDARHGFNNNPLGYSYRMNGTPMFDGGHAVGRRVPSSIMYEHDENENGNSGPGGHVIWINSHALRGDPLPGGMGVQALMFPTALSNDPYIYYDPNAISQGSPYIWMIYNWDSRKTDTGKHDRGRFLGAFPMVDELRFDPAGDLVYLAANRNNNNKIEAIRCDDDTMSQVGMAPNGATNNGSDAYPQKLCEDAVAEQPSMFYNEINDRYYVLFSRNYAFSSTYQIVYRMTEPGQAFEDLDLSDPSDSTAHPWNRDISTNRDVKNAQEFVLLKSNNFGSERASFGNGDVFSILDADNHRHYYLLFHAKMDGSSERTPMVKELTFESNGQIRQLAQGGSDPVTNIFKFRWPKAIPPAELP